ncbi:MAG: UvrB/UvrC motif-containing protein [Verrucomicrobia bacterium]|nr:UvrB/UvrC motif-containing protein [Verrucomicrobiota bacterium]
MAKPPQCNHCKKPATIHLTQIVDNTIFKVDLCEDCPHKKIVTDPEGFSLAELLVKPDAQLSLGKDTLQCEQCGFTPADFKKIGRLGCPGCYETFRHLLNPLLVNMHRDIMHCGKVPKRSVARVNWRVRLKDLEQSLAAAIQDENYERAAELRDKIIETRAQLDATTEKPV